MNERARPRVPGEDVPLVVPAILVALGALLAVTASRPAEASAAPAAAGGIVAPATPSTSAAPPPPAEPPPAASVESAPAKPARPCPRLVIRFESGLASGPASAGAPLAELSRHMRATEDTTLLVEGHADAVGDEMANLRLSRERATWVARQLEASGVRRARVTVRGLGAFSPVAGEPETNSVNRRVVVTVSGPSCTDLHLPEEEIQ